MWALASGQSASEMRKLEGIERDPGPGADGLCNWCAADAGGGNVMTLGSA